MRHRGFSQAEINDAPPQLAEQMRQLNDANYYLRSFNQFAIPGILCTLLGLYLGFVRNRVGLAFASFGLGMVCNIIAHYYNEKAGKILRSIDD